jgi:hypothetical protein
VKQAPSETWNETADDRFVVHRRPDGKIRDELRRNIARVKFKVGCHTFPTDIEAIASEVGIREIRSVPLASRGRLLRARGGYAVEINDQLQKRDYRFVLAHEIAHILLTDTLFAGLNRRQLGYSRIEKLCDFGAREILLPLKSVRGELKLAANVSLSTFADIAEEADCSLRVVAEVVSELPGAWQGMFLFCRSRSGCFDVEVVIPATAQHVELGDREKCVACRAVRENGLVVGQQSVWFDDQEKESDC